jgi:DNA-binding LacI/PurR family transcriptional regulator
MAGRKENSEHEKPQVVTLKALAAYVGLTPGTVSAVLNNSRASASVPERTKKRILAAAQELKYRPNFLARSLRVKRTYTIGVIAQEIGDVYGAMVISGVEQYLRERNYFFLTVIQRHDPRLLQSYSQLLVSRGVEGIITVDTSIAHQPSLPTVAIAGHKRMERVTNIILDHRHAVLLALRHLFDLGHRRFAFMKGPPASADTEARWQAICEVSGELGIEMGLQFAPQTEIGATPEPGYEATKEFLATSPCFTALFAYNDLCAIGAIRALDEAGLRVPEDVSVVGFDDIPGASYSRPSLTTVRQPMQEMGQLAARTLLDQIEKRASYVDEIAVEPELIVRQSTSKAPAKIER